MAFMAAIPAWLSTAMSVGGSVMSAVSGINAAKANQAQLNQQAGQTEAVAQREAEAQRRKSDLMISRAMAVGAASGAGTAGMEGILAGIAGEGEKAAGHSLYSGRERAAGMRYQGKVGVANAKSSAFATVLGSVAKELPSMSKLFEKTPPPATAYGYAEGDGLGAVSQVW